MGRAVCLRCGGDRGDYRQVCPACGHRAEGEGLAIAWLISDHHLSEVQLDAAALRIRNGESIRPSARMIQRAKKAIGTHFESDPGLPVIQRLGILATSLLLTPLVGLVCWFWWRESRPRAAAQALWLSLPALFLFFSAWIYLRWGIFLFPGPAEWLFY